MLAKKVSLAVRIKHVFKQRMEMFIYLIQSMFVRFMVVSLSAMQIICYYLLPIYIPACIYVEKNLLDVFSSGNVGKREWRFILKTSPAI